MPPPSAKAGTPITVALVDDYDVVLMGLARMFDGYRDRVVVAEIDANKSVVDAVDIVLYDSFAQPESDHDEIKVLVDNPSARRVVVYTWNFHPDLVETARQVGVHGYLSKTLSARELVEALEAVHSGDMVVSPSPERARSAAGLDWPGKQEGLTDRESEILALITQGKSNADVARLTFLSPNTVKSYIRNAYRKIGADSRTQAVLWGVAHGFRPRSSPDRPLAWRPVTAAARDWPATAEALMRSRFDAFQDGDVAWLLSSWHASTRPASLDLSDNPEWRRLQIVDTVAGGPSDDEGIVEFNATYLRDGEFGVLRERSRFVRDGGRWYYVHAV